MDFSKLVKSEASSYGLTIQQKAMADLMAMGWKQQDAFLLSHDLNPAYSDGWHKRQIADIMEKEQWKDYYSRVETIRKKSERMTQIESASFQENAFTKDEVANELIRTIRSLPVSDPKRADVLMKYADLTQMKKADDNSDDKTVHFYLPLSCKQCELYLEHKKKRKNAKS